MSARSLLLFALVTSCDRGEHYPKPPTLQTTLLCDADKDSDATCEIALRWFVAEHPEERVVSLATIPGSSRTRGLLVVHTNDSAPYPRLRDVRMVAMPCESVETCRAEMELLTTWYPDATVWAVVSDWGDERLRALALLGPRTEGPR